MSVRHWHEGIAPLGPAVCAIGMFDGVHAGHRALIGLALEEAARLGVASAVVTFDEDPEHVLHPDGAPARLTDLDTRLRLLRGTGVDDVLVVPFDRRIASMRPRDFCEEFLIPTFPPTTWVVGENFRFGHEGKGDPATLRDIGSGDGIDVIIAPLERIGGEPVSATRIRSLIERGEVSEGADLLGRPHVVPGVVVRGRGEGACLAVPTANISETSDVVLPADGVYAGLVGPGVPADTGTPADSEASSGLTREDAATLSAPGGPPVDLETARPAAVSVGPAPSFPDTGAEDADLEAHLIGFTGDLYGRHVEVGFVERLRAQRAFTDRAELSAAIEADIAAVRDMLGDM